HCTSAALSKLIPDWQTLTTIWRNYWRSKGTPRKPSSILPEHSRFGRTIPMLITISLELSSPSPARAKPPSIIGQPSPFAPIGHQSSTRQRGGLRLIRIRVYVIPTRPFRLRKEQCL